MSSSLVYLVVLLVAFCLQHSEGQPFQQSGGAASGANAPPMSPHQNTLLGEVDAPNLDESLADGSRPGDSNYDKRVERYAFGLGRRAYTYTSGGNGIKRLPVYNFGLGKRARPYSFGLGKRSGAGAEYDDDLMYGDNGADWEQRLNAAYMEEKRNRPYSFGLGKRDAMAEDVDRRGYPNRYGFGLGR